MTGDFRYAAFISYSHADEAWARWLHRRLENYRVPARLVGKAGARGVVPPRIGRCFRDQVELSTASQLGEVLQQALRQSQSLIIVCSPRSVASHWVNEEINLAASRRYDDPSAGSIKQAEAAVRAASTGAVQK